MYTSLNIMGRMATTKTATARLPLTTQSTISLFIGLLSSAYISFLAGQHTSLLLNNILQQPTLTDSTTIGTLNEERITTIRDNINNNITDLPVPHVESRLPSGQHLFIDIININSELLSSKHELVHVMQTLHHESTMLSYHCHHRYTSTISDDKAGLTCVAILLNEHITLHTWPRDGVILLDFFSHDNNIDLIAQLPLIEETFITLGQDTNSTTITNSTKPKLHWSHKLRGLSYSNYNKQDKNPMDSELGNDILRRRHFDIKRLLVSTKTKFQQADIYEIHHPHAGTFYSMVGRELQDGSSSKVHQSVGTDRALFIDGVLQSSLYGEAAYHESLVHPAVLGHPNPKRVAIIGGGEGATLREVLKHKSIDEAVMIEIDEELTNISRIYLPEWSDCSDISSSLGVSSCFGDPRASLYFEDAFRFFLNEFGDEDDDDHDSATTDDDYEDPFDVIIMDALDPDDFGLFVDKLYNDTDFIKSLYNGLTHDGILVAQVGAIPSYDDPPDHQSVFYNRQLMLNKLEQVGFQKIYSYDESHCHFYEPWQFIVAFKDSSSAVTCWTMSSAANMEVLLHQRLSRTKSGQPALRYFDGSTMTSFQIPPKVTETNYCRQQECQGYTKSHSQDRSRQENLLQALSMTTKKNLSQYGSIVTYESILTMEHKEQYYGVYNPAADRWKKSMNSLR